MMSVNKSILLLKKDTINADLLPLVSDSEKLQILQFASSNITNTLFSIESSENEMLNQQKIINSHFIALYDKFVVAFACLMMFFIGAPLGAIIKKGGIGLPIVFAVLIFITFNFINTFGKKLADEDGITPFLGCWMSSIILTPIALLLTYRATNDIGLINIDSVLQPFQKLFQKIFPSQK
jgi:lipopolysaccharide export system permease protein